MGRTPLMSMLAVASVVALCACVPAHVGARPVALPNGTQGYAIHCNGVRHDISDCMNTAAEVCGGAYQVIDRDGNATGAVGAPLGNGAVFVRGVHRTLIVSCRH